MLNKNHLPTLECLVWGLLQSMLGWHCSWVIHHLICWRMRKHSQKARHEQSPEHLIPGTQRQFLKGMWGWHPLVWGPRFVPAASGAAARVPHAVGLVTFQPGKGASTAVAEHTLLPSTLCMEHFKHGLLYRAKKEGGPNSIFLFTTYLCGALTFTLHPVCIPPAHPPPPVHPLASSLISHITPTHLTPTQLTLTH